MRAKVAFALLLISATANAETKTWTGAINNRWSVAGNWAGGIAPVAGDALVFNGAHTDMLNDIAGVLPVDSLTFVANTDYFVDGNGIALANGLSACCSGRFLTLKLPVTLTRSQTFSGSAIFYVSGPVDLNGFTLTFETSSAILNGSLNGSGAVVIDHLADGAYLPGTGSFSGSMTLSGLMNFTGNLPSTHLTTHTAQVQAVGYLGDVDLHDTRLTISYALGIPGQFTGADFLSTHNISIDGGTFVAVPGERVIAAGSVTLSNVELSVMTLPPSAQPGQSFVIIDNDAADPVNGTFRGLPEGAVLIVSGKPLRVSYKGGDGNDVSLTVLAATAADIPAMSHIALLFLGAVLAGVAARAIR
jgi:fibronectin-binding autotransporter adhesin